MENNRLNQAKDAVAKRNGYNDWKSLSYFYMNTIKESIPDYFIDAVAIEYANNGWIDVNDAPPKENGYYLCHDTNVEPYFSPFQVYRFDNYNKSWFDGSDGCHPQLWQPLPHTPQK